MKQRLAETTLTVLGDGEVEISCKDLSALKPGQYQVIPEGANPHETRFRRVINRAPELVTHLGELRGWYLEDGQGKPIVPHHREIWKFLARFDISTTHDLRRVGWHGLEQILSHIKKDRYRDGFRKAVSFLKSAMSDLRIAVPQKGKGSIREIRKFERLARMADFDAYKRVNLQKDRMATHVKAPVSRITVMDTGAQIVCGNCKTQHLNVALEEMNGLCCSNCGRDLEVDFRMEVNRRAWFG